MGYNEPIGKGRISREMLSFNIGAKYSRSDYENNSIVYNYDLTLEAGENISADNTIEIINDKAYKATNLSAGALAFAINAGNAGETINLKNSGIIESPLFQFEPGKPVYLINGSATPTTTPPNRNQTGYYRKLGYSIGVNKYQFAPEPRVFVEN